MVTLTEKKKKEEEEKKKKKIDGDDDDDDDKQRGEGGGGVRNRKVCQNQLEKILGKKIPNIMRQEHKLLGSKDRQKFGLSIKEVMIYTQN